MKHGDSTKSREKQCNWWYATCLGQYNWKDLNRVGKARWCRRWRCGVEEWEDAGSSTAAGAEIEFHAGLLIAER